MNNKEIKSQIEATTGKKAFEVSSSKDRLNILKEHNTDKYVYILIADGKIELLGEGTGSRGNVMFPGMGAPAHLKAIPMALVYHTSNDIMRLVIPMEDKEEALLNESALFEQFNFHNVSLDDKNDTLWEKRRAQLINDGVKEEDLDSAEGIFDSLLFATGTDIGTYKKLVKKGRRAHSKAAPVIKKIVGGYFTDI